MKILRTRRGIAVAGTAAVVMVGAAGFAAAGWTDHSPRADGLRHDLALSTDGDPDRVEQGVEERLLLAGPAGLVRLTRTVPVVWDVWVHTLAVHTGEAAVQFFDPVDEPVSPYGESGRTYPDLFTHLRFTVTDVTDPGNPVELVRDLTASEVNELGDGVGVVVGPLDSASPRHLKVEAVTGPGVYSSVYGRSSTSVGIDVVGETW